MASSSSVDDESLDARNVPSRFQKKIPATEDYVLHGLMEKVGKKQNESRVLCLTRHAIYHFNPYDNNLISRTDLREVYRCRLKKRIFTLELLHPPSLLSKKYKIAGWGSGESAQSCIHTEQFIVDNDEQIYDWVTCIKHVCIDRWQFYFEEETKLLPAPEVYQGLYFVSKVNRKNKLQSRFLVLSTEKLYNVDVSKKIEPRGIKWTIDLKDLLSITRIADGDNSFAITLQLDPTGNAVKSKSMKEVNTFLLNSEEERVTFCQDLKRLYYLQKQKELQLHETEMKK